MELHSSTKIGTMGHLNSIFRRSNLATKGIINGITLGTL